MAISAAVCRRFHKLCSSLQVSTPLDEDGDIVDPGVKFFNLLLGSSHTVLVFDHSWKATIDEGPSIELGYKTRTDPIWESLNPEQNPVRWPLPALVEGFIEVYMDQLKASIRNDPESQQSYTHQKVVLHLKKVMQSIHHLNAMLKRTKWEWVTPNPEHWGQEWNLFISTVEAGDIFLIEKAPTRALHDLRVKENITSRLTSVKEGRFPPLVGAFYNPAAQLLMYCDQQTTRSIYSSAIAQLEGQMNTRGRIDRRKLLDDPEDMDSQSADVLVSALSSDSHTAGQFEFGSILAGTMQRIVAAVVSVVVFVGCGAGRVCWWCGRSGGDRLAVVFGRS